MTHLELSQNFAKTYKTRVYDNNVLVKGSPFMSNADAYKNRRFLLASVGLNRTTRVVARYLDTGKSYQERYEFTTKAK